MSKDYVEKPDTYWSDIGNKIGTHEKLLINAHGERVKTEDIHENLVVDGRLSHRGVYSKYGQDLVNKPHFQMEQLSQTLVPPFLNYQKPRKDHVDFVLS